MLVVLLVTLLGAAIGEHPQTCANTEAGIDFAGNDCCGGTKTLNSTEQCCTACSEAKDMGCRFWTYAAELQHCYLKSSDTGRRKSSGHSSGPVPSGPAPSGPVDNFRWPFSPSPFVVAENPRDGLPDFDPLQGNYSSKTIACPASMQRDCCGLSHGDESCGPTSCTTRPCDGGIYCAAFANTHKFNETKWLPNLNSSANHRIPINRTRRNILQRAVGWLAIHAPYLKCHTPDVKYGVAETCAADDPLSCPMFGHTASCEGYVTMAHGAPGYDDSGDRVIIPCSTLEPGDGCFHHDSYPKGGVNHVWMFREWATPPNTSSKFPGLMRLYQMGGGKGAVNMNTQTAGGHGESGPVKDCNIAKKGPCIVCFRYAHLVNETGRPI
jgi:hypothetical protein